MTNKLDPHGWLSLVEGIAYLPVIVLTFILTLRHGFLRESGWIYLVVFSLIRIIGSGAYVAAEMSTPENTNLFTTAVITQGIGLSPLLLATLGFLGLVATGTLTDSSSTIRNFRLMRLLATIGLILSLIGGINSSSSSTSSDDSSTSNAASKAHTATIEIRAGALLFLLLWALVSLLHASFLIKRDQVDIHRRSLLHGITFTLPVILVRVGFSILASFSTATNSLHNFNIIAGDWRIYLAMALVPEYLVVWTYIFVGLRVPRKTLGTGVGKKMGASGNGSWTAMSSSPTPYSAVAPSEVNVAAYAPRPYQYQSSPYA